MAEVKLDKNQDGYKDPTAFQAIKQVIKEEETEEKQLATLVFILKYIINLAGFEPISRIELRSKKSGRVYK